MKMSEREAKLLNEEHDGKLRWIDVTTFGDADRMVLITTPRCGYCGKFNPTGKCAACGASIRRDGPL